MPTAREALLDAAYTALARRPWSAVRMVDVAAAAGVSRQTLYNEFGSKDGIARALVRREADGFLTGVDRALASGGLDAMGDWTLRAARANALVRALLTGCWGERLPVLARVGARSRPGVPAQRRADGPLPAPGELLAQVRDRAAAWVLGERGGDESAKDVLRECEVAVRLALSYVVAPAEPGRERAGGPHRQGAGGRVSAPSRRAADR
ncbi:TetR/AcrR family transcriptional regulator [Streptomyces sp. NPDC060194]|uniref:TetR/AcrR family transcriptional regulator n=1 Tax=Streptomyces sp. NPDC060194 TaxID=3347069 RepID=UPI003666F1E1